MADRFNVEMDELAIVEAMTTLGDFAQPFLNEASRDSAESVDIEASARLRRQLGATATGQTEAGIESRPAFDGNGYVVIASNTRMPNLPLWIEKGTEKGEPHSSKQAARPFFYVSAELEKGPHFRRISDAVQDAIDAKGLGD